MRILITGGTGLIGGHLCRALLKEGHELTVLSRRPETVATKCGAGVHAMRSLDEWLPEQAFDAVINLAGEPIADALNFHALAACAKQLGIPHQFEADPRPTGTDARAIAHAHD